MFDSELDNQNLMGKIVHKTKIIQEIAYSEGGQLWPEAFNNIGQTGYKL